MTRRWVTCALVVVVALAVFDCSPAGTPADPLAGDALSDGGPDDGTTTTFGFGAIKLGGEFFLIGPQLANVSDQPLTIQSAAVRVSPPGATNVGWDLYRVPARGTFTGFSPALNQRSADFYRQLVTVTTAQRTLAAHTRFPDNVFLYEKFVVRVKGAYKTGGVRVVYRQGRVTYVQTFPVGYRFQLPDVAPLP